jgi:hypothetical protein
VGVAKRGERRAKREQRKGKILFATHYSLLAPCFVSLLFLFCLKNLSLCGTRYLGCKSLRLQACLHQTCRSGKRSTRPSSSGATLIWQDSRLVGRRSGSCAIEQRILLLGHRRKPIDPSIVDIDMAGGAHGVAAAFGHNFGDAVGNRELHRALAGVGIDALRTAVGVNKGDGCH